MGGNSPMAFTSDTAMLKQSRAYQEKHSRAAPRSPLVQRRPLIARHILLSLGFVSAYLVLALPGTIFISKLGETAWYPANGLALAFLLDVSPWYALLVAFSDALAGAVIYHQPLLSFGETLGAASLALWYGTAAAILRGPLKIDSSLRRGRDVARYILVVTAAAILSTATGVAFLAVDHTIRWHDYWLSAQNWFIGDEIGLLGLAPFLLTHILPRIQRKLTVVDSQSSTQTVFAWERFEVKLGPLLEVVGQALAVLAVLWIMFGPRWGHLELLYLSFIPILWMAIRHGIRQAVTGILAVNFGIVIAMHLFPPPPLLLDRIGILMFVMSATGLVVGSTVTERHQIASELHERTTYLNALIENNPLGIAVLNRTGTVELANLAFSNLFEREPGELIGANLDSLLPKATAANGTLWSEQVMGGHPLRQTLKAQRKDGRNFDVELQAVPLVIDGSMRGAYTICQDISEQVRASRAEREHSEALSRLIRQLEVQTGQMTLLNEMAGLLECCATTKEACSVVDQSVRKLFPEAVSGALYTFRASRNLVEVAVSWGESGRSYPVFAPEACWALRRGQPHWSSMSAGVACAHLAEMPAGDYLCLPMVGQGETLGTLHLHFPPSDREVSEMQASRQRLAASAAAQIALSLASVKLREKLRDQSIRDPLTGLFNRRFMEESLQRELIRARRKNHPLSVLFLDIDHFKRFNDTFGHDAGDLVLQSAAELLTGFFRGDDIPCRWGGEEFAVILPDSTSQNAATRADELRSEVKKLNLRYRNVALAQITVSIGVAAFPEHGSNCEELFRIADRCLYQSKSAGRDRVTVGI